MQEEQHHSYHSLFNHGLFFPDSGRSSTLQALRNAVTGSASLITCVGEEGYGKTMLSKILADELPDSYLVISFPSSVDSFDYILQIIALKLDLTFSVDNNTLGNGPLLTELSRTLRQQGKRLMILIDEAEKLYLATLERLRKMIDLVNEDGVMLQIILFGRPGLQAHIEQLALCTFKEAQEVHLVLPSLTAEETFQYLNFCIQQQPGWGSKNIFSREVASKILSMSHGNFKKINSLAEDSLRSSAHGNNDTSFMVLLEHVQDSDGQMIDGAPAHRLPFPLTQKTFTLTLGALLMIIFLFLFSTKEDKKTESASPLEKPSMATQDRTPPAITETKEPVSQPVQTLSPTEPAALPIPDSAALTEKSEPVTVQTALATTETTGTESTDPTLPATKESVTASVQATTETARESASVNIAPLVETQSSTIQTISAGKSPRKNAIPLLSANPLMKNKRLIQTREDINSKAFHKLPEKSLTAGEEWLSGKKNDQFTLQLMVLSDNEAKERLIEILRDHEEREETGKYIILKKPTSPTTFLLFYGEYPTLASANNARENLAPSLQKYTPYPVSIKQAVQKTTHDNTLKN